MSNYFGESSQGARNYQEDYFTVTRQNESDPSSELLFVLADGMGGHAGGDVASKTAVQAFQASFVSSTSRSPVRRFRNALKVADHAIADRVAEDANLTGMGCTLIGAIKLHNGLSWISVGDSHIFLFRDNRLRKLNADHSMFGELLEAVEAGTLTLEQARQSPHKNALRSALVGKTIPLIDEQSVALEEGDILIFATDGIDTLSFEDLQDIVRVQKSNSPEKLSKTILRQIAEIDKANQDNTTVVTCYHTRSKVPFWNENSRWTLTEAPSKKPLVKIVIFALAILALVALVLFAFSKTKVDVPIPQTQAPTAEPTDQQREIQESNSTPEVEKSESAAQEEGSGQESATESGKDTKADGSEIIPESTDIPKE